MRTERTEYMMKDLEFLEHVIDQKSQMILDANDRIWEYAELAYHETRSADLLCQILKDHRRRRDPHLLHRDLFLRLRKAGHGHPGGI